MRKTWLIAALMVLGMMWSAMPALAGSSCSSAANLVSNCDFGTGDFTGWTLSGNTANPGSNYYGVDTFDACTSCGSTYGAYMSNDLIAGTGTVNLSQTLSTVVGQQYVITFWLEQDTAPTTGYTHTFAAEWGGSTILSLTPTVSSPGPVGVWTEYTFTETASSASTILEFLFENDDSYWSFDDVSAVPLPEPSTGVLAGTALFALLLLRRKFAVA